MHYFSGYRIPDVLKLTLKQFIRLSKEAYALEIKFIHNGLISTRQAHHADNEGFTKFESVITTQLNSLREQEFSNKHDRLAEKDTSEEDLKEFFNED